MLRNFMKISMSNIFLHCCFTTPMSPLIPANVPPSNNDSAVYTELGWLDATLASAQAAGQKVWLLMHVPPGAIIYITAILSQESLNGST